MWRLVSALGGLLGNGARVVGSAALSSCAGLQHHGQSPVSGWRRQQQSRRLLRWRRPTRRFRPPARPRRWTRRRPTRRRPGRWRRRWSRTRTRCRWAPRRWSGGCSPSCAPPARCCPNRPAPAAGARPPAHPLVDRRGLRPLPAPPARRALRPLRGHQTGRRPRRVTPAGLRPLRRPPATAVRTVRTDSSDRPTRPRRPARHLRRLLPASRGHLRGLRTPAALRFRRHGHPDLHRPARRVAASPAPAAASTARRRPAGRGAGLRPLLHRRAAPPRRLRQLSDRAPPGRPARPRRDDLRRLRRAAHR